MQVRAGREVFARLGFHRGPQAEEEGRRGPHQAVEGCREAHQEDWRGEGSEEGQGWDWGWGRGRGRGRGWLNNNSNNNNNNSNIIIIIIIINPKPKHKTLLLTLIIHQHLPTIRPRDGPRRQAKPHLPHEQDHPDRTSRKRQIPAGQDECSGQDQAGGGERELAEEQ